MKLHELLPAALLAGATCLAIPSHAEDKGGGELRALGLASEWINSPPLTAMGLHGKVVLIDFWTYSCINWIRTLPHVRAWAEKYRGHGLVVVGVHTPEFTFEKDIGNVRQAAVDMRVGYPVAIDSDYAIWDAFRNQHWPALYLLDAQGRIRYRHFGEGAYDRSEMMIRELLQEAGAAGLGGELLSVDAGGVEAEADWRNLKSPETYMGHGLARDFASRAGAVRDRPHEYAAPSRLTLNEWALSGNWTVKKELAVSNGPKGRIAYRFHARDLHLVMGPALKGASVRFRLLIDGKPPGAAHGVDVDAQGNGTVDRQRLYQLVRQPGPVRDRQFEIEFLDSGVEAFVFTFG